MKWYFIRWEETTSIWKNPKGKEKFHQTSIDVNAKLDLEVRDYRNRKETLADVSHKRSSRKGEAVNMKFDKFGSTWCGALGETIARVEQKIDNNFTAMW